MPRSRTRVAYMAKLLTAADPDVMVQVVRLVVLFEDMKLEMRLLKLPEDKRLDEIGAHYRKTYVLRRMFATLLEIDSALIQLDRNDAFRDKLLTFGSDDRQHWEEAIQYFAQKKQLLRDRRNAYGGHTHANVAKYVLGLVDNAGDSTAVLELRQADDRSIDFVFRFAQELVNAGLFFDVGTQDHTTFMKDNMWLVVDAFRHASLAIQILASYYVLPTFGYRT